MNRPDEPGAYNEPQARAPVYPFSAVVGHAKAKEALLLAVINPSVHGVLFLGPKGTGKTTLVRSLNSLLPQRRIIELPIGSSEDMVLGAVDAEQTLATGKLSVRPGILARADRAVLYIDEVNLLPDHLVDIILDAAASGEYRLEREGLAATYPARFVLTGSMNPEEGWLRPQLLDRFGLAVHFQGLGSVQERARVLELQLAWSKSPEAFQERHAEEEEQLRGRLSEAVERLPAVGVSQEIVHATIERVLELGVSTSRVEIAALQAARARAAWHGRSEVLWEDVGATLPLALQHRLGEEETQQPLTWEHLDRRIFEGRREDERERAGWFPSPFYRKKKADRRG